MMKFSVISLAAITAAVAAGTAHADDYFGVQINGTTAAGVTNYSNPLPYNTSTTQPLSDTITLSNGDIYTISGTLTASNNSNGGSLPVSEVYSVTYDGDGHGGLSQADTISVNLLLADQTTYGYGNFGTGANGYLSSGLGTGSSAAVNSFGLSFGPFSAAGSFSTTTTVSEDSTNGQFDFGAESTSIFGAGSVAGSYIEYGDTSPLVATTPIPGSVALFGSVMAALAGFGFMRQRKNVQTGLIAA